MTKKFPFPLKDGESIAVTTLSKSLVELGAEMTLLSMNTTKHYVDISQLPNSYSHYNEIHTVDLDNRVTIIGALLNLFSKDSYHVSRFHFRAFEDKLVHLLRTNDFDIIQLETLYLAPYIEKIRQLSNAKVVMRSHNVEFEIWNRVVSNTRNPIKKIYLSYLTKKLKAFELGRLPLYDALVTVTPRDLELYESIGYKGLGLASAIGLDVNDYPAIPIDPNSRSISFIGSLDWIPNLEGLDWFLQECFPLMLEKDKTIKIHIAGRNTPDSIRNLQNDNIVIHGEVDSAIDFLNAYPVTIVPLLSGSGMRVKILEGMALGRVVVSTSIGAEGIHATHGKSIIIEDEAVEFAQSILAIFYQKELLLSIGISAREFISSEFDQKKNASMLLDLYRYL